MNNSDLDSDSGISTIPRTATSLKKAQEIHNAQDTGTQTSFESYNKSRKYSEQETDTNDDAFVEDEDESEQELKSIGRRKPFVRLDTFDIYEKAKLRDKSDDGRKKKIESDDESRIKYLIPSSSDRSSPESYSHRKSVSFDLSGDERARSDIERSYSPDIFGKQFYYDSEQEYNSSLDSRKGRDRGLKGILRSTSPSTTSEKPKFMAANRISESEFENYSVPDPNEAKINSDDEIERENPFREAFLSNQKIELDDEIKKLSINRKATREHFVIGKPQPMHSFSKSNEDLCSPAKIPLRRPVHVSTSNLTETAAPARKPPPPIPPKPKIKQANVVRNVALTQLQSDLQHGDFIQYEHNIETNTIREIPVERPSSYFNPDDPLPAIPDKISSRKLNKRPMDSPPPPPVNLATLPIPAKFHTLPSAKRAEFIHENSPDNILVTEDVHRNVLLQENEIRNRMIETTDVNSVNSPTLGSSDVSHMYNPVTNTAISMQIEQQGKGSHLPQQQQPPPSTSTNLSILSPTHIFPPPQILPVQYTHLPTPQQPGGYYQLAHQQNLPPPPPPNFVQLGYPAVTYTIPNQFTQGYNTYMSPPPSAKTPKTVSDKKKFFESAMEEQHKPAPKAEKVFSFLSKDEVEKLKQEEERKIATLKNNKKNRTGGENVDGGIVGYGSALGDDDDNNYADDDDEAASDDDRDNVDNDVGGNDIRTGDGNANDNDYRNDKVNSRLGMDDYENDNRDEHENEDSRHISLHSMIPTYVQRLPVKKQQEHQLQPSPSQTKTAPLSKLPKPSPPPKSPALAMFTIDGASKIPIRSANAEKRANERENSTHGQSSQSSTNTNSNPERTLSPLEIEARKAEKRAAWRQARLKSLEQDAIQAQAMIQSLNRITDDLIDDDDDDTKKEVETCQEKIISLELQDPEKEVTPYSSQEADGDDDTASIVTIRPNPDKLFLTQDYSENDGNRCATDKLSIKPTKANSSVLKSLDPGGECVKMVSTTSLTHVQSPATQAPLRTIVEVVNPVITGDGFPNKIAIGRSSECSYPSFDDYSYSHEGATVYSNDNSHHKDIDENYPQNDSENEVDDEEDEYDDERINTSYNSQRRGSGERELSLNDKMKNVLQELLKNERVKLNLSRSLIENDSSDPDDEDNDDEMEGAEELYSDANPYHQNQDGAGVRPYNQVGSEQHKIKSNGNYYPTEMDHDSAGNLKGSSSYSYKTTKGESPLSDQIDAHSEYPDTIESHVFYVDGCRVYRNPNIEMSFGDDDDDGSKHQTTTTVTTTNKAGTKTSTTTTTTTRTIINELSGTTTLFDVPLAGRKEENRSFGEKLMPQMQCTVVGQNVKDDSKDQALSVDDWETLQSQILHHIASADEMNKKDNEHSKLNRSRVEGKHYSHDEKDIHVDVMATGTTATTAVYDEEDDDDDDVEDIDIDQDTMTNNEKITTKRIETASNDSSTKIITGDSTFTRTTSNDEEDPLHQMITTTTTTTRIVTSAPDDGQLVKPQQQQQQQQQQTTHNQSSSTTSVTTKKKKRKPKNKKK